MSSATLKEIKSRSWSQPSLAAMSSDATESSASATLTRTSGQTNAASKRAQQQHPAPEWWENMMQLTQVTENETTLEESALQADLAELNAIEMEELVAKLEEECLDSPTMDEKRKSELQQEFATQLMKGTLEDDSSVGGGSLSNDSESTIKLESVVLEFSSTHPNDGLLGDSVAVDDDPGLAVQESQLQVMFAEQTAREMREVMDWYKHQETVPVFEKQRQLSQTIALANNSLVAAAQPTSGAVDDEASPGPNCQSLSSPGAGESLCDDEPNFLSPLVEMSPRPEKDEALDQSSQVDTSCDRVEKMRAIVGTLAVPDLSKLAIKTDPHSIRNGEIIPLTFACHVKLILWRVQRFLRTFGWGVLPPDVQLFLIKLHLLFPTITNSYLEIRWLLVLVVLLATTLWTWSVLSNIMNGKAREMYGGFASNERAVIVTEGSDLEALALSVRL